MGEEKQKVDRSVGKAMTASQNKLLQLTSRLEDFMSNRLVILNKDGEEGSSLNVANDLTFGREATCSVRIKVPDVSREHAVIKVSNDGKCHLHHLSKTNPTILNGKEITETVTLKNSDVITIGCRSFRFRTEIDDDATVVLPRSKVDAMKAAQVKDASDSTFVISDNLLLPKKASLPTASHKENPQSNLKFKALGEELLHAIKKRRVSYATESAATKATSSVLQASKPTVTNKSPGKPKLMFANTHGVTFSTQLKAAVDERRKKMGDANSPGPVSARGMTDPDRVGSPSKTSQLMKAVEIRRKSIRKSIGRPAATAASKPVDRRQSLNSALLEAFEKRKKTVKSTGAALQPETDSSLALAVTAQLRDDHEGVHKSIHKQPTPFKKVFLNRGGSLGFPVTSTTPRRKSLRRPSDFGLVESTDPSPAKPTSVVPSATKASPRVLHHLNRHIRFSISDEVRAIEDDHLGLLETKEAADTVAATCTQIAVDAFAIELERQGLSAGEAYHEAVSEYLSNPSTFAPACGPDGTPRLTVRRRESLAYSLEKKAEAVEERTTTDDIVAALTDTELDMINEYADKIEATGVDGLEAYALALDSFVTGIENCSTRRRNYSIGSVDLTHDVPTAGLRDLFEVPSDYEGDEASDLNLVEIYANEMTSNAGIDSAVAYGIALDSFIADPEAFRQHVTALYPVFKIKALDSELSVAQALFKEEHGGATYTDSYGASLRKLFQLPIEFHSEDDDALDVVLVERYADEIQQIAGLDEALAYGVALDSFISNPIDFRCRNMRLIKSVKEPEVEAELTFGASLQRLFKLPAAYASDHERDLDYVEKYALELQEDANIDEALAYGIALDAFNADPIEFRKHVLLIVRQEPSNSTLADALFEALPDEDESMDFVAIAEQMENAAVASAMMTEISGTPGQTAAATHPNTGRSAHSVEAAQSSPAVASVDQVVNMQVSGTPVVKAIETETCSAKHSSTGKSVHVNTPASLSEEQQLSASVNDVESSQIEAAESVASGVSDSSDKKKKSEPVDVIAAPQSESKSTEVTPISSTTPAHSAKKAIPTPVPVEAIIENTFLPAEEIGSVEVIAEISTAEVEAQLPVETESMATVPTPGRNVRSAKKATPVPAPVKQAESSVSRPKRGAKPSADVAAAEVLVVVSLPEQEVGSVEVVSTVPVTGRAKRGAKVVEAEVVKEKAVSAAKRSNTRKAAAEVEPELPIETEIVATAPTPARSGRSAKKATPAPAPVEDIDCSVSRPKRGAKATADVAPVEVPIVAEAPVVASRAKRGAKVLVVEEEVPEVPTTKRSRTTVKAAEPEPPVVVIEKSVTVVEPVIETKEKVSSASTRRSGKAAADPAPVVVEQPSIRSTRKAAVQVPEPAVEVKETTRSKRGQAKDADDVPTAVPSRAKKAKIDDLEIICDGCDKQFSMKTVKLDAVPAGDWFCSTCERKKTVAETSAASARPKRGGRA